MNSYARYIVEFLEEFELGGTDEFDFSQEMDLGAIFGQRLQEMQGQLEGISGNLETKEAQLQEMSRVLEHITRQFVAATGKIPAPPPTGGSPPSGQLETAEGMGGGAGPSGAPGAPSMG